MPEKKKKRDVMSGGLLSGNGTGHNSEVTQPLIWPVLGWVTVGWHNALVRIT